MAEREVIQTEYEVRANTRKFDAPIKKSAALQKKHLKETTKLTEKLDKATRGVSKDIALYGQAAQKALTKAEELQRDLLDATGDTKQEIEDAIDSWKHYQKLMEDIGQASDELRRETKARIVAGAKEVKQAEELLAVRKGIARLEERKKSRGMERIEEVASYGGKEMGDEMSEAFKEALSSISSRDFGGLASGLAKAVGSAGKGALGGAMRASAGGGGGGALGGIMKSVGPVLNVVAKLGPLVMGLSSMLMAVVKVFLDADAAAKDFNKSVLESTSTAGFLSKNMGNAAAATEDLKSVMGDMYKQATSLDNLQWGISKETHQQIESAILAQGVQIDKVSEYFDQVKKGRVQSQGMVKDWGSMVQMSVGYSRAFGVSMNEVADLQGELMSELGLGFDGVQAGFQSMVEGAEAAGIGSNKFFGQMRAISADLSLFNLRIEDAAKLMAKLDKSMSPRKAAEFFQTISKFFKGMGLMDRAKFVLAGGGTKKTKDRLQTDLNSRIKSMADTLPGEMGKELSAALNPKTGGAKALTKFLAKNDAKLNGEQRDAIVGMARQQMKLQQGGVISLASALKDASPFAAMDQIEAVAKNMFGKPLDKLTDVQIAAMDQAFGINDEQLDQFAKLKSALDVQKETIASKLENGDKLTDEEIQMLDKLGVKFHQGQKDSDAADALRGKDSKQVWDNMNKNQQDLLRGSAGTLDQAKRQGELTQSIIDKLGVISDFLLGKLYQIFADIWDSILDLVDAMPGVGGGDKRKLEKIQVQAIKEGNQPLADLAKKFADSGGTEEDFKKAVREGIGKQSAKQMADLGKQIDDANEAYADLQKQLQAADSDDSRKYIEAQIDALQKTRGDLGDKLSAVTQAIEGQAKGGKDDKFRMSTMAVRATKSAGLSDEVGAKLEDAIDHGATLGGAFEKLGVSVQDQMKIMDKMKDQLSSAQLVAATTETNKALGVSPDDPKSAKKPADETPKPSAQHEASDKAGPVPPAGPAPGVSGDVPDSRAAAAATPTSKKSITPKDLEENTEQQGQNVRESIDDLRQKVKKASSGIVFNGPWLKNQYGGQVEDSVYNAAAKALFEYYMYSDLEREDVAQALKKGISPKDFGRSFISEVAKSGEGGKDKRTDVVKAMAPNAEGGVVTRPAPGEVLASVKPGERIVPAGGGSGGSTIRLELVGDLSRIIRAEAHNAIAEDRRRSKFQ